MMPSNSEDYVILTTPAHDR